MKHLSFLSGAALALCLALGGSALFSALVPFVASATVLRLLISLSGFAYLLWLIRGSRRRTGRVTAATAWIVVSVTAFCVGLPLPVYLLVHAVALWLMRSLLYYSGALPALVDLGISALSVSAAAWAATRSGSVFLAVWCFFLVQAVVAMIPQRMPEPRHDEPPGDMDDDRFEQAQRRAEAAFRQLIARAER